MTKFSNNFYAHPFRRNGVTHAVVTTSPKVRRGRGRRLICGPKLTQQFQRLAPSIHRMGMTPVTCDSCVASIKGLHDELERRV